LPEELVSNSGRIRRKVVFPEKSSSEEEYEETMQSDSDEESICDEPEGELESSSDSDIDSKPGSDSNNEGGVTRKAKAFDIKHKDALPVTEDSNKDKIHLSSENKSKEQKLKGALAEAEYKLLNMMDGDGDVDVFGNIEDECKEHGDENDDDESSDEVPTKKLKVTDEEMKENQSER
jgi:hypothetical protein